MKKNKEIQAFSGNYTLDYGEAYELEITAEDGVNKQSYPILLYPQMEYRLNAKEHLQGNLRLSLGELTNANLLKIQDIVPKGINATVGLKIAFKNLAGVLVSDTTLYINTTDVSLNLRQISKDAFWKNGTFGNTGVYIMSLEADPVAQVSRTFAESFKNTKAQDIRTVQFDIPHLRTLSDYQNVSYFPNISILYPYSIDFQNTSLMPLAVDAQLISNENLLTFKNVNIDCQNNDYCGIFAKIKGTLSNVLLENIKIQNGKNYVGTLAGYWDAQSIAGNFAENIVVKNSQIAASNGNQVGGVVGSLDHLSANTVLKEILAIHTTVLGSSSVGGLVGKIHGGKFIQSGVLATTVHASNQNGGLLIGEVDARSFAFTLQDIQTVGILSGNADKQGGVLGYINNGGSASHSIFNRVIALPVFPMNIQANKVGIFAGYIDGPANSAPRVQNAVSPNGTDKKQYQNMRVYGASNVSSVTFTDQIATVSGKVLSVYEDAKEFVGGSPTQLQTYYDRRGCPSTVLSGRTCLRDSVNNDLFFDNTIASGITLSADRKNAPMYWSSELVDYYPDTTLAGVRSSTFFPIADERTMWLRQQELFQMAFGSHQKYYFYEVAEKSGATLTYNYFPLSKFGTSPISFPLEATIYTYYNDYEPIVKNYSYLLHNYEGIGGFTKVGEFQYDPSGTDVFYYKDKTKDMFVPLDKPADIFGYKEGWRSNYPGTHTDRKTILLEAFGKRGYDIHINNNTF